MSKEQTETNKVELFDKTLDIMQDLYNKMSTAEEEGGWNDHFGLFHLFADLGRTLVEADRCSFWKWDKINHKLITNAAVGTDQIVIDENTGLVGRAIREKKPVVTNDPYNCPDFNSNVDKATGYTTKSILVIPCFNCKGEMIGAYQAINKLTDEGFVLERDVRRLSVAAVVCGITLEADSFLSDSQTDKLTKLRNRMGLHSDYTSKYLKLMKLPEEEKVSVSIIMCDIDHFKRVNDTYGHNAGDAVLEHVAKNLKDSVRESDTVYRWGGEEFIIFLAKANLDQSAEVAERIRKRIEASVCTFEGTDIKITMSFGCNEMSPDVSVEENIKVADTRLYIAKETGRNQVIKETIEGYEKVES